MLAVSAFGRLATVYLTGSCPGSLLRAKCFCYRGATLVCPVCGLAPGVRFHRKWRIVGDLHPRPSPRQGVALLAELTIQKDVKLEPVTSGFDSTFVGSVCSCPVTNRSASLRLHKMVETPGVAPVGRLPAPSKRSSLQRRNLRSNKTQPCAAARRCVPESIVGPGT